MPFAPRIAFVDVETTGTSPGHDRITEIAIVSVECGPEGWQASEWHSLVNPGQPIPPEIRFLTGITDEMVAQAPSFADLAPEILSRLQSAVFVAHLARFDYGFVRAGLERAGHAFSARTLCTVRLSRLMDPDRAPHSLDAIIARYALADIERHRALGDARALWQFVQALMRRHSETELRQAASRLLQHPGLPAHLGADALAALPQAPGVYAMLGRHDQPLYIGRSRNLRRRVSTHFSADPTRERAARLAAETHRLQWHQTAGELGARLLEGQWIRTRQPSYNIAQRRTQPAFIQIAAADTRARIVRADCLGPHLPAGCFGPFASRAAARAVLLDTADRAGLCLATLGLERRAAGQPCFRRQLGRCGGACVGLAPAGGPAAALAEALRDHEMASWPWDRPIALFEAAAAPPTRAAATTASGEGADDAEPGDWHVFHHWRHLGSVHSRTQALALAASCDEPTGAGPAGRADNTGGLPPLEPDIYRLLRARLAAAGQTPCPADVRLL